MKKSKYIFDIILIFLSSFLIIPLIFLICISILIFMGKPIFFIHERIGYKNRKFKLIKFRTMSNNLENNDNERITFFGSILRKMSLDELPELFNVIKGDMSLVGPRPLLVEYLKYYDKNQIKRHNVLPGITGLAQINGRNSLSWEEKFELDLIYVSNNNLLMDAKIILKTFIKVFFMENIKDNEGKINEKFSKK